MGDQTFKELVKGFMPNSILEIDKARLISVLFTFFDLVV